MLPKTHLQLLKLATDARDGGSSRRFSFRVRTDGEKDRRTERHNVTAVELVAAVCAVSLSVADSVNTRARLVVDTRELSNLTRCITTTSPVVHVYLASLTCCRRTRATRLTAPVVLYKKVDAQRDKLATVVGRTKGMFD